MKKKVVAARYAKAFILLAQSAGKVDEYGEEIERFAKVFEEQGEMRRALLSPIFDRPGRRSAVRKIAGALNLSPAMQSFLQILIDKERMVHIPDIFSIYRRMADEMKGRVRIAIRSAIPLSSDLLAKIREQMQRTVKKEVILEVEVLPELIGGLVAQTNDLVIDGSIRNQIVRLQERLESALGVA